jgi:hypothetical protein
VFGGRDDDQRLLAGDAVSQEVGDRRAQPGTVAIKLYGMMP